ncbi:hypothetical protein C0992_002347, partial [Termitomyces sp. T32_za158]
MSLELLPGAVNSDVLSSPPFVVVPGVINLRALGGSPLDETHKRIKPLHIFRSGELTRITEDGRSKLRELGVTTVFDLRSDTEIAQLKSQTPNIPGVHVVRAPAVTEDAWKRDLSELLRRYQVDELQLMGVDDSHITHDYSLSAIGLAPSAPAMQKRFRSVPVFRDNWEGYTRMSSAKAETMAAVLSMIREKFGGVERYLTTHAGLTDEDL